MYPDALYEAAFRFREGKLWLRLNDYMPFAVKRGEKTLYVNASGDPEFCICTVYDGAKNVQGLRRMAEYAAEGARGTFAHTESLASQNCLQLMFENRDRLTKAEAEGARAYAKAHGISLRGRHRFPQFLNYTPFYLAAPIEAEGEAEILAEALRAASAFGAVLEAEKPEALYGPFFGRSFPESVPLMEPDGEGYVFRGSFAPFPAREEAPAYAPVKLYNELAAHAVKRIRPRANICCELVVYPEPLQETPAERPYFTWLMFACFENGGRMLQADLTGDYRAHPERIVNAFLEGLKREGVRPGILYVRDARTQALLSEVGKAIGAAVVVKEEQPALDEAEEGFIDYLNSGVDEDRQAMAIAQMLLSLDEKEAKEVPRELLDSLSRMLDVLPPKIAEQLKKRYRL